MQLDIKLIKNLLLYVKAYKMWYILEIICN